MLDRALERLEAKEGRNTPKPQQQVAFTRGGTTYYTQPPKQVTFVRGGTFCYGQKELGEHPTLRTSKGTNTGETEGDAATPVLLAPREIRCEIPLDYNRINRMQLEGYLTKPGTYDMVRLYLAYLCKNRDKHYEGQTFISVRVKLRAMGFPVEVEKVREIYMQYCRSQGNTDEETERDLTIFEKHICSKRVNLQYADERTRARAMERASQDAPVTCDPECVIL